MRAGLRPLSDGVCLGAGEKLFGGDLPNLLSQLAAKCGPPQTKHDLNDVLCEPLVSFALPLRSENRILG